MLVRCLYNARDAIPQEEGRWLDDANFSDAPLEVGQDYLVAGILLYRSVLTYLVADARLNPVPAPAGLFEIVDGGLPPHWRFAAFDGLRATGAETLDRPLQAMWGYDELVENSRHLEALFEFDENALVSFRSQILSG